MDTPLQHRAATPGTRVSGAGPISGIGVQKTGGHFTWENGYNESFNGKLRDELLNGEIFYTLKEAEVLIEQWRNHYNTVRPHSALGYRAPAPQTILPVRADHPFVLEGLRADRRSSISSKRLN